MNRLDRAKGRLAGILTPEERQRLALITAGTVVAAARDAGLEVWLLGPDVAETRRIPGASRYVGESARHSGLSAQLSWAIRSLKTALILHADLPLASGKAVDDIIAAAPHLPCAVGVESPDGGTNALLLDPPGRFPLAYGPGSFAKHRAAAETVNVAFLRVEAPDLQLDLDTPEDIRILLASPRGALSEAGAYLLAQGLPQRLAELG
ncbi:MAG: 2-phospho-L-lactate guanylyltransferase [Dehalococcoidia bacterium]